MVVSINVSNCRGIFLMLKLMMLNSLRYEVLQEGCSAKIGYMETGFFSWSAQRRKSSVSLLVSYLLRIEVNWLEIILMEVFVTAANLRRFWWTYSRCWYPFACSFPLPERWALSISAVVLNLSRRIRCLTGVLRHSAIASGCASTLQIEIVSALFRFLYLFSKSDLAHMLRKPDER